MLFMSRFLCAIGIGAGMFGVSQAQIVFACESETDLKQFSEVRRMIPEDSLRWAAVRSMTHAKLPSGVAVIDLNDAFGIQRQLKRLSFIHLLHSKSDSDGLISVTSLSEDEKKLVAARFFSTDRFGLMIPRATGGELELFVHQYLFFRIDGEDFPIWIGSSDLPESPKPLQSTPLDGKASSGVDPSFLDDKPLPEPHLKTFAVPQPLSVEDVLSEARRWFERERDMRATQIRLREEQLLDKLIRARGFEVIRTPASRRFVDLPETLRTSFRKRFLSNFQHHHFKTIEEANAALEKAVISANTVDVVISVKGVSGSTYNETVLSRSAPVASRE